MSSNLSNEEIEDLVNNIKTPQKNITKTTQSVNLYKVLGVEKDDSQEVIGEKYRKKMAKYHPDKIKIALSKLPLEERDEERDKMNREYILIRDAYSILKNKDKRKLYDIELKQIESGDIKNMKNSFTEFIKLQESEINEKTKELTYQNFKTKMIDMDKKRNFNREEHESAPMSSSEASRRYNDLIMSREQEFIEYAPKNLFGGNLQPSAIDFNTKWEIMKGKEKKKKNNESSVIPWDSVGASNEFGYGETVSYTSINKIEDIFNDENDENNNDDDMNINFSSKVNLEDVDELDLDSDSNNSLNIDVSYVTDYNKNKEDTMKKYHEYEQMRHLEDLKYKKDENSKFDSSLFSTDVISSQIADSRYLK